MYRHIRGRFATDLLRGIPGCDPGDEPSYEITQRRQRVILAWMRAESGNLANTGDYPNGAGNNPLGSTYPFEYPNYFPPEKHLPDVKNYPDFETGVTATLQTLFLPNHNYEGIIAALQTHPISDIPAAIAASDWGTGAGVSRSLIAYVKDHFRTEFLRPVGEA